MEKDEKPSIQDFDVESILLRTAIEVIRLRPAMYIGMLDVHMLVSGYLAGLLEPLFQPIDDPIPTTISVRLKKDGTCIIEDDAEQTVPRIQENGETDIEAWVRHLYAPGSRLYVTGVVINALSDWLTVEIAAEGRTYRQHFEDSEPHPMTDEKSSVSLWTRRFSFHPTLSRFIHRSEWSFHLLVGQLRESAVTAPGTRITLTDERIDVSTTLLYPNGIHDYLEEIIANRWMEIWQPIALKGEKDGVRAEIALRFCSRFAEGPPVVHCFVNNLRVQGGSLIDGFVKGFGESLGTLVEENDLEEGFAALPCFPQGFECVIWIRMEHPRYAGSSKDVLESPEAAECVYDVVVEQLPHVMARVGADALLSNQMTAQNILKRFKPDAE